MLLDIANEILKSNMDRFIGKILQVDDALKKF